MPFDIEMGKNQKAIKVLQRLFDAGYGTEKGIVNMTMDEMLVLPGVNVTDGSDLRYNGMDEMLVLPGVNVADLFIISELQRSFYLL